MTLLLPIFAKVISFPILDFLPCAMFNSSRNIKNKMNREKLNISSKKLFQINELQ
jgi:hypothetical protein